MNAAASSDQFYVTLFRNSSSEIYKDNTLAAFTIILVQPIELNYAEKLEVGICEVTCPPLLLSTGVAMTTRKFSRVGILQRDIRIIYRQLHGPLFTHVYLSVYKLRKCIRQDLLHACRSEEIS